MELSTYFKSIIDQDTNEVVICDLNHTILYLNEAARIQFKKRGDLLGRNLLDCHGEESKKRILEILEWFQQNPSHNIVHTFYNPKHHQDIYMIALRDEEGNLIGYYEKHEVRLVDESPFYQMED